MQSTKAQLNQHYRIYPKYSDTSTPYHICSKIWTSTIHYPMLCLKIAGWVANSVDPDETPHSAASHLGLYCLLRPVCPNIYGKYGIYSTRTLFLFFIKISIFFFIFLHDNIIMFWAHVGIISPRRIQWRPQTRYVTSNYVEKYHIHVYRIWTDRPEQTV